MKSKLTFAYLALAIALLFAGSASAAPAAPSTASGSKPAAPTAPAAPASNTPYTAIKMVSSTDGWIVGQYGRIFHYTHGAWLDMPSPASVTLNAVDAAASEGWIVGDANTILQLVNGRWQQVASPAPADSYLSSVSIVAPAEAWALGNSASGPILLHYADGAWTLAATPPSFGQISWASPNEAWLVDGTSTAYHYLNGAWSSTSLYDDNNQKPMVGLTVAMLSPNLGWIGSHYEYDYQDDYPTHYLRYSSAGGWRAWPCTGIWTCPSDQPAPPAKPSNPRPECTEWFYTTDHLRVFTNTEFYAVGDITRTDCVQYGDPNYWLWRNNVSDSYADGGLNQFSNRILTFDGVSPDDLWLLDVAGNLYHSTAGYAQVPLCPAPYADVPNGYYARAEIAALTCSGIVAGTDNTHFAPNANASRIQFAKLITLALGWQVVTPTSQSFTDVPPSNPLYPYVETAHAHGAIQGGTQADCAAASATYPCFTPNQPLTRAQAALILQRAYAWPDDTSGGPHFSDVPADHFAYTAIETCYQHAVISGVEGGQFLPAASITRGQIAVILYKALTLP